MSRYQVVWDEEDVQHGAPRELFSDRETWRRMLERAAKSPEQPFQRRIRPPDVAAIYQFPHEYGSELVGYVSSEDIQDRIALDEMEGKNAYIVRQRLYPGEESEFP